MSEPTKPIAFGVFVKPRSVAGNTAPDIALLAALRAADARDLRPRGASILPNRWLQPPEKRVVQYHKST